MHYVFYNKKKQQKKKKRKNKRIKKLMVQQGTNFHYRKHIKHIFIGYLSR